jgi:antirestriction protein ArdC
MIATASRPDVYEAVTRKILDALKKGVRPWAKGWRSRLPQRHNGEFYKGVNVFELWFAAEEKGYRSPFWMTYKQAQELGAYVKKGEKATQVVYWGSYSKQTGKVDENGDPETKKGMVLRLYYVFNAEQIEGLPAKYYPENQPSLDSATRLEHADQFVKNTGADIRQGGSQPAYYPQFDYIKMPAYQDFHNPETYYSTIFHELTHWTGPVSRTGRVDKFARFGDEKYAREELVAELGAAFLCAILGVSNEPREDHASYLKSWAKILTNDKKAFVDTASKAQTAVDYLHGLQPKEAAE